MGVTLPLTAEGQKREKTMEEIKKLRKEGANGGKSYGSERERALQETYKRVGREQGNQKGD